MAVTINPQTFVISIPKSDLTLVQSSPTEIREMDLNWFRLELKSIEASLIGMYLLKTHNHNTEVSLSGLTFARVIEILDPYSITFENGLYAVNLVGANSNVGDKVNVNQVSVRSNNSAGLTSSPAVEHSSFNGYVTIDVNSEFAGTAYPIGTQQKPVNNLADALLIAEYRGFSKLLFQSDFTFISTINISHYILSGEGFQITNFIFENGCLLNNCEVYNAHLTGIETGLIGLNNCELIDLEYGGLVPSSIDLIITNCLFDGSFIIPSNYTGVIKILDSYSNVPGFNTPIINLGNAECDMLIRNWAGGLKVTNSIHSTNDISLDTVSGRFTLDDSITYGNVVVGGVGILKDSSGNPISTGVWNTNVIVKADSLMAKATVANAVYEEIGEEIQYSSYNGGVAIDIVNGVTGTEYPIGTTQTPVNNMLDAVSIANTKGFNTLFIYNSMVFDINADINDFFIIGQSHVIISIDIKADANVADVVFSNITVTGILDGRNELNDCVIQNLAYVNGHIHRGSINGTVELAGDKDAYFVNCSQLNIDVEPVIDMGFAGQDLVMVNYSGILHIKNLTGGNKIGIGLSGGILVLHSDTVTSGFIHVSGTGTLIDENNNNLDTGTWNNGVTIINSLISKNTIATAVWDEQISEHLTAGSTGLSIGISQFEGAVHISNSGVAGSEFPIGTRRVPVNNIPDAVLIAEERGLDTFYFDTDFHFDNTINISNYVLSGRGMGSITLTFDSGSIIAYCTTKNVKVSGDMTGIIGLVDCCISDFGSVGLVPTSQDILVKHCLIDGTITLPSNYSGTVKVLDCWSNVPGSSTPTLDMGNSTANLHIRNYSGGIELLNITEAVDVSVDIISGHVILDSSITNGDIIIRGVGKLTDNSSANINSDGLMSIQTIAIAVSDSYAGEIHININSGISGTSAPIGTLNHPVDNLADAILIADELNIKNFVLHSNLIITQSISGYIFDAMKTNEININGQTCLNTQFNHALLTGTMGSPARVDTCRLDNLQNLNGSFKYCVMSTITPMSIAQNANIFMDNCRSGVPGSDSPILNFANGGISFNNRAYSGGIRIQESIHLTNIATVEFIAGKFNFGNDNTAGSFSVRGVLDTTGIDESSTATIILNGAINTLLVVDKVWDEPIADHLIDGSTGHKLNTASAGGVDYPALADAVWNEDLSTFVTENTAGNTIRNIPNNLEPLLKRILGLTQQNFRMTNQTYNIKGNLTASTISIYETSADCNNAINEITNYSVNVIYEADGIRVNDYKVIEN